MDQSPWEASSHSASQKIRLMESKGSLSYSQESTTGIWPEPDESNLYIHTLFL
jgi:hypothetical protein